MSAGAGQQLAPITPAHPSPAAEPAPTLTPKSPKPPRPRKQAVQTENWDDDFEFSLPAKPKATATPRPIVTPKRESLGLSEGSRGNSWRSSYDSPESSEEDWDEPGPSRTPTASFRQQLAKPVPVMLATSPTTHLQLPRSSNSHSPSLPSPSTPSNGSHRNLVLTPTHAPSKATPRRSSDGSPASAQRAKPGKRSSASLVPAKQATASTSEVNLVSAHGLSPAHWSSPNLLHVTPDGRSPQTTRARSNSKPPTPSPLGSTVELAEQPRRVSSPTKQQRKPLPKSSPSAVSLVSNKSPASTHSSIFPSRSPSKSPEPEKGKKPRFWKRLSAGPSTASPEGATSSSPFRRRRSTSAANLAPPSSVEPPVPPLPPLPVNLRASSGQSAVTSGSAHTPSPRRPSGRPSTAGSIGSSNKQSIPFGARSSSSLVQQPREFRALTASPVPYPYSTPNGPASSSSINMAGSPHSASPFTPSPSAAVSAAGEDGAHAVPRPRTRTFSPGFHLPSPSPGSPYAQRAAAMSATSVQYSSPLSRGEAAGDAPAADDDGTDTEVEAAKTPVRRKKIRPASAIPAPRPADNSLTTAYNQVNASVPCLSPRPPQAASLPPTSASTTSSRQTSNHLSSSPSTTATSITSSGHSQGIGSSTQTTLRRLTSFSKKHGRRLSGGWKFGSTSSTSTTDSGAPVQTLETVNGSPSKPPVAVSRSAVEMPREMAMPGQAVDDGTAQVTVLPPHRSTDPPASAPAATTTASPDAWAHDGPADVTAKGRPPKERRRTSFNDFVIPSDVMAKQKDLKRGIGAVKKFAGGIQALKILVDTHERATHDILTIGSEDHAKLFFALDKEYSQWWEMATVLIEVGSTGSADSDAPVGPPSTASSRQISGADEARSETSSAKLSTSTMATITTSRKSTMSDPPVDVFHSGVGGPPKASPPPDPYRASTGRHDLSKRQLEVLRTMLTTPVEASDSVVATVDRQAAARATAALAQAELQKTPSQQMPPPQWTSPQRSSMLPPARQNSAPNGAAIGSPNDGFVFPSPSYPSPETAANLAQPTRGRSGMTGLKDLLKSMRRKSQLPPPLPTAQSMPGSSVQTPVKPKRGHRPPPIKTTPPATAGSWESPPESPLQTAATDGMFQTQRSYTALPITAGTEGSPQASKKRRPSIKNIFRQSSGNWAEFMRATPPSSPNGVVRPHNASSASLAPPTVDGRPPSRSRRSSVTSNLPRQPSIPALARLKMGKSSTYGSLGVAESPTSSPTRPGSRHRPSVGQADAPSTPPVPLVSDSEHAQRLKSRALGLGHPAEGSPRALSSPARAGHPAADLMPPDEAPRSRSDGGMRAGGGDEIFIALTPENLPVLLDYARQCERKLEQWHQRAVHLEAGAGVGTITGLIGGAGKPPPRVPTWGRV